MCVGEGVYVAGEIFRSQTRQDKGSIFALLGIVIVADMLWLWCMVCGGEE